MILHHSLLTRQTIICGESLRAMAALWRRRWHERTELARLTRAELRDVGLTPYDARCEARKPFWRA